jgi:hypothetical protein
LARRKINGRRRDMILGSDTIFDIQYADAEELRGKTWAKEIARDFLRVINELKEMSSSLSTKQAVQKYIKAHKESDAKSIISLMKTEEVKLYKKINRTKKALLSIDIFWELAGRDNPRDWATRKIAEGKNILIGR